MVYPSQVHRKAYTRVYTYKAPESLSGWVIPVNPPLIASQGGLFPLIPPLIASQGGYSLFILLSEPPRVGYSLFILSF